MALKQDLGAPIGKEAAAAFHCDHGAHGGDLAADLLGSGFDIGIGQRGCGSGKFEWHGCSSCWHLVGR